MSSSLTYKMRLFNPLSSHGHYNTMAIGDHDTSFDTDRLDAKVKSGDYFVTLATVLDILGQQLVDHHNKKEVISDLEQLTTELLYLQHHYNIIKKV